MSNTTPVDRSIDLEKLLDDYGLHLQEVRGLACETCEAYRWSAQRFLGWLGRKRSEAGQSGELIFPSWTKPLRGSWRHSMAGDENECRL